MSIFDNIQTARTLQTRDDLINASDDWLIKDLVPLGQAGLLIAPMKSMKSSVSMQMAIDVAEGTPFFGYETTKCKTLLIDNEDTDRELNKRLRNKDEASDNLYFLTGGEFSLDNPEHFNKMALYIKDNGIKFVILDNLMTMVKKSSLYDDTLPHILDKIRRLKLKLQDVTFMLIAHANKSTYAQSMREKEYEVNPAEAIGGYELSAWAEYMIVLSPKKGKNNKYVKLSIEARGYSLEDSLNFAYVDDVLVMRNASDKKPLYVKEKEKELNEELVEKSLENIDEQQREVSL